jgi:predicted amidohydrolase YtcJ
VIDVLTGERLYHRAVETAADGTVAQVAATAPAGLPDAEIVDVAGRWLLPGLISCHTHMSVVCHPFGIMDAGPGRTRPLAWRVPVPDDAPAYDRLAAWFGPDPGWTP